MYSLFEVYGVEMEFMIVDRDSLAVRPICDELIFAVRGEYASDVEHEDIDWSNELVSHVVELKVHEPAPRLEGLSTAFHDHVKRINALLETWNACLLPTGAHPTMDPFTESRIWPHDYNEVYSLYNRIFDCRGHGWSNLQSTHLNLPFEDDAAFGALHAAIRIVLPLIPALTASTPYLDGRATGYLDSRLETYRHNQALIPVIAGEVVPEPVFTRADYQAQIFTPIRAAIAPYDTEGILDQHFLNSRGAIARFDRGAIEIRIIDLQECPAADLGLLQGLVAVIQALMAGRWEDPTRLRTWQTAPLAALFREVIRSGGEAVIDIPDWLGMFGLREKKLQVHELWLHLHEALAAAWSDEARRVWAHVLRHGNLSSRILRQAGPQPSREQLHEVYSELARCLAANRLF